MIAFADASPLRYLVLIGEIDLLPKLFANVAVLHAVIAELLHDDAPEAVRTWASNLPAWIAVRDNPLSATAGLHLAKKDRLDPDVVGDSRKVRRLHGQ
jgi:predicted nucleic acid-binding protein